MANETHNGNSNRSTLAATGTEGLKSTGKSNDCEASLRKGNLPKPEAVRTATVQKGAAVAAAHKQNRNDGGDGLAVIPNTGTLAPPCSSK